MKFRGFVLAAAICLVPSVVSAQWFTGPTHNVGTTRITSCGNDGGVLRNDGGVLDCAGVLIDDSDNVSGIGTLTTTGDIIAPDGASGDPSIRGTTGTDTGLSFGNGIIRVDLLGGEVYRFSGTNFVLRSDTTLCFDATGIPSVCETGSKLTRRSAGVLGVDGSWVVDKMIRSTPQDVTCADSGDGSPGTLTLTPTSTQVHLTNADANGCTVTMGEGSAVSGDALRVIVVSNAGGTVDFADTAGVSELSAAFNAGIWDSISMVYVTDRFVETARSDN